MPIITANKKLVNLWLICGLLPLYDNISEAVGPVMSRNRPRMTIALMVSPKIIEAILKFLHLRPPLQLAVKLYNNQPGGRKGAFHFWGKFCGVEASAGESLPKPG